MRCRLRDRTRRRHLPEAAHHATNDLVEPRREPHRSALQARHGLSGALVRHHGASEGCRVKVVIVGGNSSVGLALKAVLSDSCDVITAGRKNCDIALDLAWPLARFLLPEDVDAVVHTAAHFGGK